MSDYGFEHNGRIFTPNQSQVSPENNAARNQAIEAAELAHWQTQPDRMLAYYHFEHCPIATYIPGERAYVTTWGGRILGQIIYARIYRHNFGSRMVSIRVQGNNGAVYYGRASWDHGQCINLRRAKS